eukprot:gene8221-11127_t
MAVIDINGGSSNRLNGISGKSSLVALCSDCFHEVEIISRWTERRRICLKRLKLKNQSIWLMLLTKIPFSKINESKKKKKFDFDDPNYNNKLLKNLKRRKL